MDINILYIILRVDPLFTYSKNCHDFHLYDLYRCVLICEESDSNSQEPMMLSACCLVFRLGDCQNVGGIEKISEISM